MFKIAVHAPLLCPISSDGSVGFIPDGYVVAKELLEFCQFYLLADGEVLAAHTKEFLAIQHLPGIAVATADKEKRVNAALIRSCEVIIDDDLKVIGNALASNITPIRWETPFNTISYGLRARTWSEVKAHILELSNDSQPDPDAKRGWIQVRGRPTAPPAVQNR